MGMNVTARTVDATNNAVLQENQSRKRSSLQPDSQPTCVIHLKIIISWKGSLYGQESLSNCGCRGMVLTVGSAASFNVDLVGSGLLVEELAPSAFKRAAVTRLQPRHLCAQRIHFRSDENSCEIVTSDYVCGLWRNAKWLYVANGAAGLRIFDISSLKEVGSTSLLVC